MGHLAAEYQTKPRPIYVGIDPGKNTGVAIYDAADKSLQVLSLDFWGLIAWINHAPERRHYTYVLEDPQQNKSLYARHAIGKKAAAVVGKMGRDVGRNLENAFLLIEYFKRQGIEYRAVRPCGKKWNQADFERWTGLTIRTNEHTRDATKLVWGL